MILSTSSSRAVSISTGRSPCWRMRLHTSTPSRSGSIRSRTTSDGFSDSTSRSASLPLAVVRTVKPAFLRYAATKDAIDASSSTTSTVCGFVAMSERLPARSEMQQVARDGRERGPVPAVERVLAVGRRVRHTLECHLAGTDCEQIDARAVDPDLVDAPGGAEAEVAADELRRLLALRHRLREERAVRRTRADVARVVGVVDDDLVDLIGGPGRDVADGRAADREGDDGHAAGRAAVLHDERAVFRLVGSERECRRREGERGQE